MSDFAKHYFCSEGNPRLGLEWAHEWINLFVSNSLAHFGMRHETCVNVIDLKASFVELRSYWPAYINLILVSDVMAPSCDMTLWKPID